MSERTVVHLKLASGISALDAASTVLGPAYSSRGREWTFYIRFNAGVSAGAMVVESAANPDETGTWAQQGSTVNWVAASRVHTVSITGTFLALRVRVSDALVGGTGDVDVVGS